MAYGGKRGDWRRFHHSTDRTFASKAKAVYICRGCGAWNDPRWDDVKGKPMPPAACLACHRMDFDHFQSRGEAKTWAKLLQRQAAGQIADLERQVPIDLLTVNHATGKPVVFARYIADFRWRDVASGDRIVGECKPGGALTYESQLKIRCVEAMGIPVTILT